MSMLATALTAKPGMEVELHDRLLVQARDCLAGIPGCAHFIILRDTLNHRVVHVLEAYKDEMAFKARTESESYKKLEAILAELVIERRSEGVSRREA